MTPDELDAAIVEAVLVRMREVRPYYWRIILCRYVRRWTGDTSAACLNRSTRQYAIDIGRTLAWVGGALEVVRQGIDTGQHSAV